MDVIILCGGQGTRLKKETEYKPKPMVEIGGKPILWHIMKTYSYYGFNRFILALGYRGNMIRDYFLNYDYYNADFTVNFGERKSVEMCSGNNELGWQVTLVETGDKVMTGARVKCCEKYVKSEDVMVTYGDGVADIDIKALAEFHKQHKKLGTLTGVRPPGRYGELTVEGDCITNFAEKVIPTTGGHINGGYMVFQKKFFEYLSMESSCTLEKEPLEILANQKELMVFRHDGYWQCMDTYRDYLLLQSVCNEGIPPWQIK